MKTSKKTGGTLASLLVIAAIALYQHHAGNGNTTARPDAPVRTPDAGAAQPAGTEAAWRSGQWLDLQGRVERVLRDDSEGSRHQRFIVRVGDGRTLLVAHNIDLAPRVPVSEGDTVNMRGRYEANGRGGVIHWTHHDPQGHTGGGWIEYRGKRYE